MFKNFRWVKKERPPKLANNTCPQSCRCGDNCECYSFRMNSNNNNNSNQTIQFDEINARLNQISRDNTDLRTELRAQAVSYQNQLNAQQVQINAQQDQINAQQVQINQLGQENNEQQVQIGELQSELLSQDEYHRYSDIHRQNRIGQYLLRIDRLAEKNDILQRQVDALKARVVYYQNLVGDIRSELRTQEENDRREYTRQGHLVRLQRDNFDLRQLVVKHENQIATLTSQYKQLVSDKDYYRTNMLEMDKEARSQHKKYEALQREIEYLENIIETLKVQIAELSDTPTSGPTTPPISARPSSSSSSSPSPIMEPTTPTTPPPPLDTTEPPSSPTILPLPSSSPPTSTTET